MLESIHGYAEMPSGYHISCEETRRKSIKCRAGTVEIHRADAIIIAKCLWVVLDISMLAQPHYQ